MVSATGIILIEQASTTTVTITYKGGNTGTAVVTITHADAGAGSETMRDAIQNAVLAALQTPWTKPAYAVSGLPFAVGGIAVS